jgi:hypothetical protein
VSVLIDPDKMDLNSSVLNGMTVDRGASGEEPRLLYQVRPVRREYEPLEEALEGEEAPEFRVRLRVEAPDAGEAYSPHDDRELRHVGWALVPPTAGVDPPHGSHGPFIR